SLKTLKRSTAILQALQGRVPLAVPHPVYIHLETSEIGNAFAGYKMIPGETVDIYGLEKRYDGTTCQRLADQLAEILKALHSISLSQVNYDLPPNDDDAHYRDLYARTREKLFPLIRPEARRDIEQHFERYLSDNNNFRYTPALIHGDFGTGNILFDAE